jgi:hypothetical protein
MNQITAIILLLVAAFCVYGFIAAKEIAAAILLLVAAFCVYGFIASFEPGPRAIYFRVGYPIVGVLCLVVAVAILMRKK